MAENVNSILKRIANPFIFGNIFISACTLSLFLETYLQLGAPVVIDGLAMLVFFATLFLYNFHRLMGVRRIKPEDHGIITGWASKHRFSLFMLAIIGVGGVGFFVFQTSLTIFIVLAMLGAISLLYELPVVRYHRQFQRLRNLWVHKAFMITTVWALATALLPAINISFPLGNYQLWLTIVERMIFIFILALCFDARDVEFDRRDNLKTIPIRYGPESISLFYKILCAVFIVIVSLHYFVLTRLWGIGVAMIVSIILTYFTVIKTYPRKSDYYYMFIVDGMMMAQFLLMWVMAYVI